MAHQQQQLTTVPVRLYQIDDRIMVAAPMPGLEPEDIAVIVAGSRVIIRGAERGPGQHERDVLLAEWTIGPYYRELVLPQPVNGVLTNATYGNGVLVLALPKLAHGNCTERGV
jgi:HSP20 family protein